MSVVNKMLNDLEQRSAGQAPSADYVPPTRPGRRRLWGWALVIVVCVIAALLMAFPQNDESPPAESAPPVSQRSGPKPTDVTERQSDTKRPASVQATPESTVVTVPEPATTASEAATEQSGATRSQQGELNEVPTQDAADTQQATAAKQPSTQPDAPALTVNSEQTAPTPNAGLRERIRLALEENQVLRAISLMQQLQAREPKNVALSKKLAATLFAEGQVEAARRLLSDSLALNPQQHSLRLMLARLYVQQQQHSLAIQVMDEADAYAPVSLSLLAFRGELLRERQQYERARVDYAQLTARDPGNARWWLGLAITAEALNTPLEARAAYQQALSLNQLDSEVATYMRARLNALSGGTS